MKTKIIIIILFVFGVCFAENVNAQDIPLSPSLSIYLRVRGKILLQIEDNGEAWYIHPNTIERIFLGRPSDAFQIMREQGLGVSENDYASFGGYAPSRLSGKILLRVEENGEAYYVNPVDLKMHYLARPVDAFRVMRELGLGITNRDLEEIPTNTGKDESSSASEYRATEDLREDLRVTIHSVNLGGRVFAINGQRINYTVNFKNNTEDTISNAYIDVFIEQGTTRKRASSNSVVCAPDVELLPPGFCGDTGSFNIFNTEDFTGTLVNGAARALIQITSNDKVLAEKSIPITLIGGIHSPPAQTQESVSDDETIYLGTGKTAILLVEFPDINNPIPFDKSYMDDMVFGADGDSLNDYIEEVSYGKYKLTGETIGWLTMPNNFDHYCVLKPGSSNNYDCRMYNGMGVDAPGIITDDAVKAADPFFDFSLIDRIIIVTNTKALNCSTRATIWSHHAIPTQEGMIAPSLIFTNKEDMLKGREIAGPPLTILIHEFGHNLGLKHAAGWQCGEGIVGEDLDDFNSGECDIDGYQDNSDVMGSKNRHHFSAVNKEIAGIIMQNQILTISSDGTYIIDQLELPSKGYKEIKIPIGGGNYYTLEYRRPVGYDSTDTDNELTDGVFLRIQIAAVTTRQYKFSTVRPYEPEPLIINPNKPFEDSIRGIKVEVIEKNSNQAEVRVSGMSSDIALRPQKLIALGNTDNFFLGDTLKIVKGQKDTKLFRSNVFNSDWNFPLTIKNMRLFCRTCNGVLDNMSLYKDDTLIKTITTPVYNEKLNYLIYDFNLESSNIVIPPRVREIYTFKGDISTGDFNIYPVPNTVIEVRKIEGEINGYPAENTFMSFSRSFEL